MQANEVTTERLRRLAEVRPGDGGKVLSVYVDFDPSQFGTQPARSSAITSALDEAEKEVRDAGSLDPGVRVGLRSGIERVRDFLRRDLDTSGAHGLAVFCDSTDELFEALKLPVSVHQRVVKEALPFLKPGGWLLFEIGLGQDRQVKLLFERTRAYQDLRTAANAAGEVRVVGARKINPKGN